MRLVGLFDDERCDDPLDRYDEGLGRSLHPSYNRRALPEQRSRRPNLPRRGSQFAEPKLSEGVSFCQPMLDDVNDY